MLNLHKRAQRNGLFLLTMTKKQAFKIYLITSTVEVFILSIVAVYFSTYVIQNITVGERSVMTLVGSTFGICASYIIKKRSNILRLRKYFTLLQITALVFQIVIAITMVYHPLIAGIVNTILGAFVWCLAGSIENDIWNRIFIKSSKTIVDNVFGMYTKTSIFIGSAIIIGVDTLFVVTPTIIGYGSVIAMTIVIIMDNFNIRLLEKVLKNKKS